MNYLQAGTVVWLADPDTQTVEVYIPNKAPFVLHANDTLEGGDLLPGFTLFLSEIFTAETSEEHDPTESNTSDE